MLDRTLLDTREGLRKCVNPDFSLFFVVILYFFLAALSLHWCTRAFSSCSEWRLLSSCSTWTLGRAGSIVVDHWLSCAEACGISPTRNGTCMPCIGRQILNPWTTTKALNPDFSVF